MIFRTVAFLLLGTTLACGGDAETATARTDQDRPATDAAVVDTPTPGSAVGAEAPASAPAAEVVTPAAADRAAPGASQDAPPTREGGATDGVRGAEPDAGDAPAAERIGTAEAPGAAAGEGAQAESTEEVLREVARAYEGLTSLKADFQQELRNTLLGRTTRSEGVLYQRQPDRFLMEFTDPEGDVIVSDGAWFWMYFPSVDEKQVIRTSRGGQGLDLRAQFIGDPVRRFEATDHGTEEVRGRTARVLTLEPRERLGYQRLKVWIDTGDHLVRRFELTENNGNVRHFELWDLERNPSLPDELFEFTPPPGAQVVTR